MPGRTAVGGKHPKVGISGMWCLRMLGLNIIVDSTEGVGTSHLKLIWVRGFKLLVSNSTSCNTTSLNTQNRPGSGASEDSPRAPSTERTGARCAVGFGKSSELRHP